MEDLTWMSVESIAELVRTGAASPVEVVDHFLGRIEEYDPVLHAFDYVDHVGARREAKQREADVRDERVLGPLHGVPVAVKSLIDVSGFPRHSGAGLAVHDDLVVSRLKRAGAVIVAHAGLPELRDDGLWDYQSCARNPWDPNRIAGFSSSGCAASVAAGLLPAALGSDGLGSTRLPAAHSGIIGFHCTNGLVPSVDELGRTTNYVETRGPMVRDTRDAALILDVIAGPDPRDNRGLHISLPRPSSQLGRAVEGMRFVWTDDFGVARKYAADESERVISAVRRAALSFGDLGATVEEEDEDWEDFFSALEFSIRPTGIPTAGVNGIDDADQSDGGSMNEHVAVAARERLWRRFARLFTEHDLLLSPTIHSVAPTPEVFATRVPRHRSLLMGEPKARGFHAYTGLFNWLRFPAVSVPCGFVDGLPVGLQIVGPPGSDAGILAAAHAFLGCHPPNMRPPLFESRA